MYDIQNNQLVKIIPEVPAVPEQVIPVQQSDLDNEITALKDSNQSIQGTLDEVNITIQNAQKQATDLQAQIDSNNAEIASITDISTKFQAAQVQA